MSEDTPKQASFLKPSQGEFSRPEASKDSLGDTNQLLIPREGDEVDLYPPSVVPIGQSYQNHQGDTFIVREIQALNGETTRAGVRTLLSPEISAY